MTNIEKIRAMDSIYLAEFLQDIAGSCYNACRFGSEGCEECPIRGGCNHEDSFEDWLESEVEDNA